MKNMLGFTEAFIQGSDNFKASGLSDHDKSNMLVQAINEGKIPFGLTRDLIVFAISSAMLSYIT